MTDRYSTDVRLNNPGTALLQLASDVLNHKIIADKKEKITSGEDVAAHELCEQRVDLSVTQSCIDPYRWALDKAEYRELT